MFFTEAQLARNIIKAVSLFTIDDLTNSKTVIIIGAKEYQVSYDWLDDSLRVAKPADWVQPFYKHDVSHFFNPRQITALGANEAAACSMLSRYITRRVNPSDFDRRFREWAELTEVRRSLENGIFVNDHLWVQIIINLVSQGMLNARQTSVLLSARVSSLRYHKLIEELKSEKDNVTQHFLYALTKVNEYVRRGSNCEARILLEKNWFTLFGQADFDRNNAITEPVDILQCPHPTFTLMSFFLTDQLDDIFTNPGVFAFLSVKMACAGLLKFQRILSAAFCEPRQRAVKLWPRIDDSRPESVQFFISQLSSLAEQDHEYINVLPEDKEMIASCVKGMMPLVPSPSSAATAVPGRFDDYILWICNAFFEFSALIKAESAESEMSPVFLANYYFLTADGYDIEKVILNPQDTLAKQFKLVDYIARHCFILGAKDLAAAIEHSSGSDLIDVAGRQILARLRQKLLTTASENIQFSGHAQWEDLALHRIVKEFYWLAYSLKHLTTLIKQDQFRDKLLSELSGQSGVLNKDDVGQFFLQRGATRRVIFLLLKIAPPENESESESRVQCLIAAFKKIKQETILSSPFINSGVSRLFDELRRSAEKSTIKEKLLNYL